MMTLRHFSLKPSAIPVATSWYLADLGEARGRQELFTKQSPQKLKVLREHALIESVVSSNRIEGVMIDQARVATVVLGKAVLRDLQRTRKVECLGRGPGAAWRKKGNTLKKG